MKTKDNAIRIGVFTDALGFGGADVYLKGLLDHLCEIHSQVVLFHRSEYPVSQIYGKQFGFKSVVVDLAHSTREEQSAADPHSKGRIEPLKNRSVFFKRLALSLIPAWIRFELGLARSIVHLAKLISSQHIDIMFVSETSPSPDVFALAARRANVGRVVSRFAVVPGEDRSNLRGSRRRLAKRVIQAVDCSIYNAKAAESAWLDYSQAAGAETIVIPNGVDINRFPESALTKASRNAARSELGIPERALVVGLTARLHPMKGHKYVVEAAAYLCRKYENLSFVFTGAGFDQANLEQLIAAHGLDKRFRFLGHRTDIPKITSVYDIAILPSVAFESFGNVCVEAMASCVPVVASRFGGLPEVVEDGVTGIIVEPGDIGAIIEALELLIGSEALRASMGAAGRQRVEAKYRLERTLKLTYDVLNCPDC